MTRIAIPNDIKKMIRSGALFAINHSGGGDSQAMNILLRDIVPSDQTIIIHATLGRIEWPGTIDHIKATTHGFPLIIAEPKTDFFTMVRRRKRFPTPAVRQCLSDLKRGPIERELRRHLKAHARYERRIVSCIGLRADESNERAKRKPIEPNTRQSIAGRTWLNWHPILSLSKDDVFKTIRNAGERPHWAYGAGMTRVSCSFCIMSCRKNLRTAAQLRPDLLQEYADLEREIGHTLSPTRIPLTDIVSQKRKNAGLKEESQLSRDMTPIQAEQGPLPLRSVGGERGSKKDNPDAQIRRHPREESRREPLS